VRIPNLNKWQDAHRLSGLLFFAQAVEEMLFHYTVDSFKATALNVHTLALDLRVLSNDFIAERIKSGTILHVIEELSDRMKSDPAICATMPDTSKVYLEKLKTEQSNGKELRAIANTLLMELETYYWQEIRDKIRETIAEPKQKERLIRLANDFITEAEHNGFSRSYIHSITQRFFFHENHPPDKINSLEQINDFLALFGKGLLKWKVIFRGSRTFARLAPHSENFGVKLFDNRPDGLPYVHTARRLLANSLIYPMYIVVDNIQAKDPYSARQRAERRIDVLSDVFSFHAHKERLQWGKLCLVIDDDANQGLVLPPPPNPTKLNVQRTWAVNSNEIVKTIEILIRGEHFLESSRRKFLNALDYHRAAIEATTTEHQLLSLWAILEGFLPVPTKDDARITHYVEALLPSLTLSYPEKIFRYLADSLYYGGKNVKELVQAIPIDGDYFTKATGLIVSSDLKAERLNLYSSLEHHPLLKYRCYICHEQYGSNKKIIHTINAHRKRVDWHIQRIYSTRNRIIHSAEGVPYLSTLVENLHAYIDILLTTTVKASIRAKRKISIETALEFLSIHERSYLRMLEGDEIDCTSANFKDLLFGSSNPISPFADNLS
jgi:hypothetical protein